MLRMVGFDLDDTLWDEERAAQAAVRALYTLWQVDVPFARFRAVWRELATRHFEAFTRGELSHAAQRRLRTRRMLEWLGRDATDAALDEALSVYQRAYEAHWTPRPDAHAVLAALHARNLRIGCITNGDGEQQRAKLARMGFLPWLNVVVISGELGVAKPDPRIFAALIERARVPAEAILFVGDRLDKDVWPARACGMASLHLDRSASSNAPHTVRTLSEILPWVERHLAEAPAERAPLEDAPPAPVTGGSEPATGPR